MARNPDDQPGDLSIYQVPEHELPEDDRQNLLDGRASGINQHRASPQSVLTVHGGRIQRETAAWRQFHQFLLNVWRRFKGSLLYVWRGFKGFLLSTCVGLMRVLPYVWPVLLVIVAGCLSQFADDLYIPPGCEALRRFLNYIGAAMMVCAVMAIWNSDFYWS